MQPLFPADIELLDRWQRAFPLMPRPFALIASAMDRSEPDILDALKRLSRIGVLSRIGATLRPNTVGASLLAAMMVPQRRLDEVAAIVNREAGVNHNYEREHAFNLWFVVTGRNRSAVSTALDRIRDASGIDILELPLVRGYHIDLGFPLGEAKRSGAIRAGCQPGAKSPPASIDARSRGLLEALENGLPLTPRPYAQLGWLSGMSERDAMRRIDDLMGCGVVTRFGLIVHHRTVGFGANAMAVWDVDDATVDAVGAKLARERAVTLCYRRPRRRPLWPYNLFCMIHGRDRATVVAQIASLAQRNGLAHRPHAVLFSCRCFRQRGPTLRILTSKEPATCL